MARQLQAPATRKTLREHLAAEGAKLRAKYGPTIGWEELQRLLKDPECVRFPCDIQFEAGPLLPGEFAHALPKGAAPELGYTIFVHPLYASELSRVAYLVLHQLVLVNHGEAATAEDAEMFGSLALGLSRDDYYHALCELSGQIGGDDLM